LQELTAIKWGSYENSSYLGFVGYCGGAVNSGGENGLRQPYVAAYFQSQGACQRVETIIHAQARWTKCIEAPYVQPPTLK